MNIPGHKMLLLPQQVNLNEKGRREAGNEAETPNSVLEKCVNQNNSGAVHLRNKCFQPAIEEFVEALKTIKMLMQIVESLKSLEPTDATIMASNEILEEDLIGIQCLQGVAYHDNFGHEVILCTTSHHKETLDTWVFSEPLLIQVYCSSCLLQELRIRGHGAISRNLQKAAHAIIFNMGLSYHLMAQNDSSVTSKRKAKKAWSLYGLCHKSLEEEDFEIRVIQSDLSFSTGRLLFKLVIFNNVAQLHSLWGENNIALHYKKILLKCLFWLVQEYRMRDMDPSVLEPFFQATMYLIVSDPVLAPAA